MFKGKWELKRTIQDKPRVIAIAEYQGKLVDVLDETYIGPKEYLINWSGPNWVSAKYVQIIDRYWSK